MFQSEADFQLALAWTLRELRPDADVRLERRMPGLPRIELDVHVELDGRRLGFELKYPRATLRVTTDDEVFDLRDGAADVECQSAIADLARLERLVARGELDEGCVVVLSNRPIVWAPAPSRPTLWDALRLTDGRMLAGTLAYRPTDKTWPKPPVTLTGNYEVAWEPYSTITGGVAGTFRALVIPVRPVPRPPTGATT